jgi:hypothetical protein
MSIVSAPFVLFEFENTNGSEAAASAPDALT